MHKPDQRAHFKKIRRAKVKIFFSSIYSKVKLQILPYNNFLRNIQLLTTKKNKVELCRDEIDDEMINLYCIDVRIRS